MRALGAAAFFGAVFTGSRCLSCLCSLLTSALMKLESQAQAEMPEGEWIPLPAPTAVTLVVLQGRKLRKQVFVYVIWGHSSTSSCSAKLSVHLDHIL